MPSILIIDDDAKHRKVVQHLIKKIHPDVQVDKYDAAASGGLDKISGVKKYALIILDTTVAGQDSVEWMKSVIAKKSDPPAFIFLSSIADMASIETTQFLVSTIKLGAVNFFFKKKLDMKQLINDVTGVLVAADKREAKSASAGKKGKKGKKVARPPVSQDKVEDAITEMGLAIVMINDDKKWPFTMEDILAGNA
ncbi:MAG: hypothetical protein OQL16_09050, partial [Gammaproteobacteria bacterium]|nr:hypothetical protein [Gammaproteobacteria bacterium]